MPPPRSRRIEGSATLTTTASRVTTKKPSTAAASAAPDRAPVGAAAPDRAPVGAAAPAAACGAGAEVVSMVVLPPAVRRAVALRRSSRTAWPRDLRRPLLGTPPRKPLFWRARQAAFIGVPA